MTEVRLPDALVVSQTSKIVFLILDGLGDLPSGPSRKTPLEAARKPNLDRLCREGVCGLLDPISPGITPGSGPGHLALFGYDPLAHPVGRGVLSALGLDFPLGPGDLAARVNFATLDKAGNITDRRAGRIDDALNRRLTDLLNRRVRLGEGVECLVRTEKGHRALLVIRGEGLSAEVSDTDPQRTGVPPLPARASGPSGARSAELVNAFVSQAREVLRGEPQANGVLLRGFDMLGKLPSMGERYGLRCLAIAGYPMYRGLARLVGMEVHPASSDLEEQVRVLAQDFAAFDFFYLHVKAPDLFGEDGDFEGKQKAIEAVDEVIPQVTALRPDVLVVTGDHSTPVSMRAHSWHPVPVLLWAATCRPDEVEAFGERACLRGGLGRQPMRHLMALALAHGGRLTKFGA
jgi:2,3-bisphosphoglycerate-independent phosphoglycerate mutase